MKISFITKLSVENCIKKISDNAERNTFMASFSRLWDYEKTFFYRIKGNTFRLEKVNYYRNSFKPVFYGKLIKENNGTRIEGYFGIHQAVKLFMIFWFLGVTILSLIPALNAIDDLFIPSKIVPGHLTANPLLALSIPFIFIGFGILIIFIGKYFGEKDENEIVEFIKSKLEVIS